MENINLFPEIILVAIELRPSCLWPCISSYTNSKHYKKDCRVYS